MNVALYIISILWIVLGTFLVIYTERTRKVLKKLFLIDNVKLLAFYPFIFGLILVVGAFYYTEMFWLAFILGLLGIVKGLYLVIGPSSHVKGLLEWWLNRASDGTSRLFGLIYFILGSAILSHLV